MRGTDDADGERWIPAPRLPRLMRRVLDDPVGAPGEVMRVRTFAARTIVVTIDPRNHDHGPAPEVGIGPFTFRRGPDGWRLRVVYVEGHPALLPGPPPPP